MILFWTLDFGLSKFEDDLLNQRGVYSTRYAEIVVRAVHLSTSTSCLPIFSCPRARLCCCMKSTLGSLFLPPFPHRCASTVSGSGLPVRNRPGTPTGDCTGFRPILTRAPGPRHVLPYPASSPTRAGRPERGPPSVSQPASRRCASDRAAKSAGPLPAP
jgi:hypothetical protein